jgi:hypothetical protein
MDSYNPRKITPTNQTKTMKKKRPRSPTEGDMLEQATTDSMIVNPIPSAKKRFVWPSTLHQDFIGAVFDVGLRYSTVNEVLSCMKNNPNLSPIFSPHSASPLVINPSFTESLRSYILKYQLFRDRKYNPRPFFYDLDQRSPSPSNFNRGGKLSSRSFEEEDESEVRNPGLSSQDLTTADHSYSSFSLNSNSDFDRVSSSGNNNQSNRDVHETRQKIQKQQKEILFRQNQKYIGKLEKECQELLKVIHNHWIKIEFLMKLEQDMTQEMKELIHRQAEKKTLLATQIQNTAEQFSSCCPSDSSSASSAANTVSSSFLANAVANIRNQVLQTSIYPGTSSSFFSTGTVFLPPPSSVMTTTKNNNSLTQKKSGKESSLPLSSATSSSGVAEILESKYRSIMEMKDHIKLHRLLLNKQQSQIHGGVTTGPPGSNSRINNQRNNLSNTTSSNYSQSNNRNNNNNNDAPFPLRQPQPLPSQSSTSNESDNHRSKHSLPLLSYNSDSVPRSNSNNNEHNDADDNNNNINNNGSNASQPLAGEGETTVRPSTPSNEFSSSILSGAVGGKELNWLEDDFATEEDLFSFLLDP